MTLRGIAAAVLLACALLPGGAAGQVADGVVGKVVAVRGDVAVRDGSRRIPLTVDMPLRSSHVIVAAAGKARLELADGTIVSVGDNSEVRVAQLATATTASTRVSLVSGALRLIVHRATPNARFEVETETAIAAVRGTRFALEASRESTGVVVLEGSVQVSAQGAPGATVLLDRPDTGTDVRRGAPPTPPAPWGQARRTALLTRTSL